MSMPCSRLSPLQCSSILTNLILYHCLLRNRQIGKTALWNPGCDHAGIATQVPQLFSNQEKSVSSTIKMLMSPGTEK